MNFEIITESKYRTKNKEFENEEWLSQDATNIHPLCPKMHKLSEKVLIIKSNS